MTDAVLALNLARRLRRNILLGTLKPGASIKERDTAADLGVSRTPLREAIRILATEGLVELRPARSPIVAVPTIAKLVDDVEVLIAIETLSGELACTRASDTEIEAVADIVMDMDARFDTTDPLDMFELDMSFHSALVTASHNASLAEIHGTLFARLWRARYVAAVQRRNRARLVKQHMAIVTALRARDPDQVRNAIQTHLARLRPDIIETMQKERGEG